jgi:hypothetical protein
MTITKDERNLRRLLDVVDMGAHNPTRRGGIVSFRLATLRVAESIC